MSFKHKLLVVSGEPSGDLFASGLINSFKQIYPEVSLYAMGGSNCSAAGAEIIADSGRVAVMGFIEVISRIKVISGVLKKVSDWIYKNRPDAVVLVDFPSFNFKVARLCSRLGIPVVYFIPPKIWASRYGRIKFIKRHIKFVITIFPFEKKIYLDAGVEAYYFGNPLYRVYKEEAAGQGRAVTAAAGTRPVFALLPGSRKTELKYHSARFAQSMLLIRKNYEDAFFIIPFRKGIDFSIFTDELKRAGIPEKCYRTTDSVSEALTVSDIAIVASGTASLEACFYGKPLIIVYYLNRVTYMLAKILVKIKYAGLINILAGEMIVTELLESDFTPKNVLRESERFLKDKSYTEKFLKRISGVVDTLKGDSNPYDAAAGIIYDKIIGKSGNRADAAADNQNKEE